MPIDRRTLWLAPTTALSATGVALLASIHPLKQQEAWLSIALFFVGAIPPWLYWHGYRCLGFAFWCSGAWLIATCLRLAFDTPPGLEGYFLGAISGSASIRFAWHSFTRVGFRWFLAVAALAAILGGGIARSLPPERLAGSLIVACSLLVSVSGLFSFRSAFELACEPPLWLMYRIRSVGPGRAAMPLQGPCLVLANHACWFDPLFLAKILPRPTTALMTSRFYDKPILHLLFKYLFRAIRVPDQVLRREKVPEEIHLAIAALDRGECVVIFPEGYLRRSEDRPLRRFGRGAWQVLAARPATPVFACWIEGNWGSFCSYFQGNPTKGKRIDIRRPITVAVAAPIRVDPAILESHQRTRLHLWDCVLEARQLQGLPSLAPLPEIASHGVPENS